LVGNQEPIDRLVDHGLEQRVARTSARDAQDAGREREHREYTNHGKNGEQCEDVGVGVAASDQQQADRRPDQCDRDRQHHANTAAAGAGLAAVEGGRSRFT
jgi:hypothetical protein